MTYLSGALKKIFGANDRLRAIHLREDPTYSIVVWKSRLRRQLRIYTPFLPELSPAFVSEQFKQEIKKYHFKVLNTNHNSRKSQKENQNIHG